MEIVLILIPVSLILIALGIFLFSWAVKNGQYDDLEGPAHRILYDDDKDLIPREARQDLPARKEPKPSQTSRQQDGDSEPSDSPENKGPESKHQH